MLRPLLKLVGIGKEATTITLVGITSGIAFGGGLLIKEAHAGRVSKKDVFTSLLLLGFCHSLIEDTLLGDVVRGPPVWGTLVSLSICLYVYQAP